MLSDRENVVESWPAQISFDVDSIANSTVVEASVRTTRNKRHAHRIICFIVLDMTHDRFFFTEAETYVIDIPPDRVEMTVRN